MSYYEGEGEIDSQIRQLTGYYNTSNVFRNDWSCLDSGNKQYYAILRPGINPAPVEFISPTMYIVQWQTIIECWRRYTNETDFTTLSTLFGDVNRIIGVIQKDKTLGLAYVQVANVSSISAPIFKWVENGPIWISQEVTVSWIEQVSVTYTS